jgi:hypothetical protein
MKFTSEQLEFYVWVLCAVLIFLIVTFMVSNKYEKTNSKFDSRVKSLTGQDLTHDEYQWFFSPDSPIESRVGYGDPNSRCPRHLVYCAGGKTFGTSEQQAQALIEAGGGLHPENPLL